MKYLYPLLASFILSVIFTPIIKYATQSLGIVDKPGQRKIHDRPIALMGGLAVYSAFSLVVLAYWYFGYIADQKISDLYVWAILVGGLILMVGGLFDDAFNLKPWQQILFPVAAIILVLASGMRIGFVSSPLGGYLQFPAFLGVIVAFFWLLGMVYTTKFLDGLDGLVSGVTVIGALIIFIVSLSWDIKDSGTSYLSLILAGSCLGFLIFNFNPAKIFLGEGGSVFCGFMLGVLSIISGSKIATALLIMGIPILDVAWVIGQRMIQGRSPAAGDNKHLHFRLLDIGFSHRQAVLFLYSVTAGFGLISIFLKSKGKLIALLFMGLFMVVLALTLIYFYRRKNDKTPVKN